MGIDADLKASPRLGALRAKLAEMFQLDRGDLDFGIYRIMNMKRDEVVNFLGRDLLPQVRAALLEYRPAEAVDLAALEEDVYGHLFTFFRRYYHEGDFLSLRRYRAGTYAIPYEGEEVKLHWANADQYYVKSAETLRSYAFRTGSGRRVRFELAAASTVRDNNKAQAGKERRFVLHGPDPVAEDAGDLVVRFEYRPLIEDEIIAGGPGDEPRPPPSVSSKRRAVPKQEDLSAAAMATVLEHPAAASWRTDLEPVLARHLAQFTARHTFDYFIHKDLGGFLRRELDFYIKNEVLHLDDIDHETVPMVEQNISRIRAIRCIAHKIIDFLAQVEDFQKRLWLKKKFVVRTDWCLTLDRVPEDLYPEIAANDAQRAEWVRLFAIDDVKADLAGRVGYSAPLFVDFLKANPYLVVDTAFFPADFTDRLLAEIDDLDAQTDGVLVHGENFQALSLLEDRYNGTVSTAYIDPPYNTGKDGFIYKDQYQHSCWLSMLSDRFVRAHGLLAQSGFILTSIGDHELHNILTIQNQIYGGDCHMATLVWNTDGNIDNQSRIKVNHEYITMYVRDERQFVAPRAVDPNIKGNSKLLNDIIENTITKNGPANPIGDIFLPTGFPCGLEEGVIEPGQVDWPRLSNRVRVANYLTCDDVTLSSGWASKALAEAFVMGGCQPIQDGDGKETWFKLTKTGALYVYKKRPEIQSHVLSVIRNVGTVQQMSSILSDMGFVFSYPKPLGLIEYFCRWSADAKPTIMDFFAGSGTTGHAVINLNREDGGSRKYILVEMGDHFDAVLKPRILKAAYSKDWKDGKPVGRQGVSQCVKVIRLESYEDVLDNLALSRDSARQSLLDREPAMREGFMLRYLLDADTAGSPSLLNMAAFTEPFAYTLRLTRNDEARDVTVDLPETFNYLLGLAVDSRQRVRGILAITGTTPDGDRALVLWRPLSETTSEKLDEWFRKSRYSTQDMEFDVIYVNGDNNLENLRRPDETWKVRLIEEYFKKLMFDVRDV